VDEIRLVHEIMCYLAVLLVLCSFLYAKLPAWQVLAFFLFSLLAYLVYRYALVVNRISNRISETTCLPFTSEEIWQFLAQNGIKYHEIWDEKELAEILSEGNCLVCNPKLNGKHRTPEEAYSYMQKQEADRIIIGRFVCERKI